MHNVYVYGPVNSRRLGSSLGVDLVPLKTCSYNCVYCQLGNGFSPVLERKIYAPPDEVCRQVAERLSRIDRPDYITLGGSGEPTLHGALGEVATALARDHDVPLCLITNGSLMWMDEVREACACMDVIVPSLDACDPETFGLVNRPHPSLTFEKVVGGLERLRDDYDGKIWLEIFLVPGLNDGERHCEAFRAIAGRIRPDKIHLNTAVRPPAESFVRPLSCERMMQICEQLGPDAEVIVSLPEGAGRRGEAPEEEIIAILKRRPCTAQQIAAIFGTPTDETAGRLHGLAAGGKIRVLTRNGSEYFTGGS